MKRRWGKLYLYIHLILSFGFGCRFRQTLTYGNKFWKHDFQTDYLNILLVYRCGYYRTVWLNRLFAVYSMFQHLNEQTMRKQNGQIIFSSYEIRYIVDFVKWNGAFKQITFIRNILFKFRIVALYVWCLCSVSNLNSLSVFNSFTVWSFFQAIVSLF